MVKTGPRLASTYADVSPSMPMSPRRAWNTARSNVAYRVDAMTGWGRGGANVSSPARSMTPERKLIADRCPSPMDR